MTNPTDPFLNPDAVVRAKHLQQRYDLQTGSSATLWRWVRAGKLPQPLYLNGQRVWRVRDIMDAEAGLFSHEREVA